MFFGDVVAITSQSRSALEAELNTFVPMQFFVTNHWDTCVPLPSGRVSGNPETIKRVGKQRK